MLMQDFNALLAEGKTQNDLSSRVRINTTRNENDDGFTSTLSILNMTKYDEGYYTCQGTNHRNERISSQVYMFPFIIGLC